MTKLLIKAIERFLSEMKGEHVYSDFLFLQSDFHGADREWSAPPRGGRLGDITFQGQTWPVVWCDSELNLRREVLYALDGKAILLIPAGEDQPVPPDIRARSHRGLVHAIGLRHLLAAETGRRWPPDVDYSEWRPAILRHRQALVDAASAQLLDITRDRLDPLLVQAAFGVDFGQPSAANMTVQLYRRPLTERPLSLELEILQGQLALHKVDELEIVRWVSEEPGRARAFLVGSALMRMERQSGLSPGWGPMQSLQGRLLQTCSQQEAEEKVLILAQSSWQLVPGNERRSLMKQVEDQASDYLDLSHYNDMSPRALRHRIEQVASSLVEGQRETSAIEEMQQHLFARDEGLVLSTLQQMDQLLGWCSTVVEASQLQNSAVAWVNWYRREGALADLAALRLKVDAAKKLGQPVEAVLERYWDSRNLANTAFAKALLSDYEATIYHPDVVGTHKILDKLVLPWLRDRQRVLLVVMDGLAYLDLVHLVGKMHEGPNAIGISRDHTGLSILPSVTAASRKAIFLGQRPADTLDTEEEYAEKAKISERLALENACKGFRVTLHNQTTLTSGDGETKLFADMQDPKLDLVALVLIHVDQDLKGGSEPRLYDPHELGVFLEAVNDGLKSGRRVLLVSDHGHTWHRTKEQRIGAYVPGGSHRHMPLTTGQSAPDFALVTDDLEIVPPPNGAPLAFLYRVGDYFGQVPQRGYHGGASLEEMVIPCVELSYGGSKLRADIKRQSNAKAVGAGLEQAQGTHETPAGVVLTLSSGKRLRLELAELSGQETQALQLLAKFGRASEQLLRQHLGTRRVAGLMSRLVEKLGRTGFDLIEQGPSGPGGVEYVFREPVDL